jgi:hypothetical protein
LPKRQHPLQPQRYKKKLIFKIKNTFDYLCKENSTEFEKRFLREGGCWLAKNGQQPPHQNGHAYQPGEAAQGRKGGHHRAGKQ